MAILRRPSRQADITACWRALVRAWDAEGIERGGYFEVHPHNGGDMNRLKFDKDSETSRGAALYNYPRRESQRWRILQAVLVAGVWGLTSDEAEADLALAHQTCSARMNELRVGGFITCQMVDGKKVTRATRSGADAEVMVATQKACDAEED